MISVVAVRKPRGISSYDVIRAVKRLTGVKKVGHAGTLDPLAEGVLVVGITREGTKQLKNIVAGEKEYVTTVRLGAYSTTDDAEGEKIRIRVTTIPTRAEIRAVLRDQIGERMQVPPAYSAVKVRGQEAYKRVRRGESVTLAPRNVHVKDIEIMRYRWPYLSLRVVTGPGVYIRSLARDVGKALGAGGYVTRLRRTRVGPYAEADAVPFDRLAEYFGVTKGGFSPRERRVA